MSIIETLHQTLWLYLIWVAVISLVIGSFLNVLIYRLPIMMENDEKTYCRALLEVKQEKPEVFNLFWPLSTCRKCNKRIKAWQNIPVISFLLLRGACAHCKTKISARYPMVEALTCIISLIVAVHFGVTWQALFALLFTWLCIPMIFIDLDHQLLPDQLTYSLLWLGLLANGLFLFIDPTSAIIGALAGYLVFWVFGLIFKVATGKEGLGHGDYKLLAAIGAWTGWAILPVVVLMSAVLGLIAAFLYMIFKRKDLRGVPIPFGPYLVIAGWVCLLWGSQIFYYYTTLFGLYQ